MKLMAPLSRHALMVALSSALETTTTAACGAVSFRLVMAAKPLSFFSDRSSRHNSRSGCSWASAIPSAMVAASRVVASRQIVVSSMRSPARNSAWSSTSNIFMVGPGNTPLL